MPIVNGFDQEFRGRVTLVRLNIHDPETVPLQEQYGFTATPEFFLVDASDHIRGHWDEAASPAQLEQAINRIIAAAPSN